MGGAVKIQPHVRTLPRSAAQCQVVGQARHPDDVPFAGQEEETGAGHVERARSRSKAIERGLIVIRVGLPRRAAVEGKGRGPCYFDVQSDLHQVPRGVGH